MSYGSCLNAIVQDPVARPGLLGPSFFSSNTPSNYTDEELELPSTTQLAVLASELSDHQVLLKMASNLIEIFCASTLRRTSVCLHFRAVVVVFVAVPERKKCFLPKFHQFQ